MTERASEIDYAPPPPVHRRRSFRRALIAAMLLALIVLGFVFVPRYWRLMQVLRWQRNAMAFVLPPETVVVEPDRERGAKLWQAGSDYVKRPPGSVYHVPRIAGDGRTTDTVFLHGRRRPDGTQRLVLISEGMDAARAVILVAWVAKPASLVNPRLGGFNSYSPLPPGPPGQRPRLFAGQPDPNDASRFTIRYEYPDRSGTIEGRLLDDDSVAYEFVEVPTSTTSPDATTKPSL